MRDELQPIRRAVAGGLVDCVTTCLLGNIPILVRHGTRNPGDVVHGDQAAQRCSPAHRRRPGDAPAVRIAIEAHGPRLETTINFRRAPIAGHLPPAVFRDGLPGGFEAVTSWVSPVSLPSSRLNSASQSRRSQGVRKCCRTYSLPQIPRLRASWGSARISRHAAAHSSTGSTAGQPVVLDLGGIPPTRPTSRRPMPSTFRHRGAKPRDRLLQHGRRVHLEGIDLDGADVVEVREDEDVRVACGVLDGLVVEVPALGVVVCHRADQAELQPRVRLTHDPGVDLRRADPSRDRIVRPG